MIVDTIVGHRIDKTTRKGAGSHLGFVCPSIITGILLLADSRHNSALKVGSGTNHAPKSHPRGPNGKETLCDASLVYNSRANLGSASRAQGKATRSIPSTAVCLTVILLAHRPHICFHSCKAAQSVARPLLFTVSRNAPPSQSLPCRAPHLSRDVPLSSGPHCPGMSHCRAAHNCPGMSHAHRRIP